LTYEADVACTAGNRTIPHAASAMNGNTYEYDCNGNQILREIGTDDYELIYDVENHLVEVKKNSVRIATFVYDGDGRRVKSVVDGETVLFIGGHYEIENPGSGQQVSKYYFAGTTRIAMRKYTIPQSMTVEYLLGDHLGSTSITTDANRAKVSELRYKPWGEVRYSWTAGLSTTPAYKLADYTFTGQYSDSYINLLWYDTRHYNDKLRLNM
jgi:YD repeat-containing protein